MTTASEYFGARRVVHKYTTFTSGSGTWTVPDDIVGNTLWLTMIGGGGSGRVGSMTNGETAGGCGGEYVQRILITTGGGTNYSIGAGGTANGSGDGVDGGDTTFGALTVSGGSAGGVPTESVVGTPGAIVDTSGTLPAQGTVGPYGARGGTTDVDHYGGGGGLMLFYGSSLINNSIDGKGYGAGSGGLASGTTTAGNDGVVRIEWYEYETN